MANPFTTILPKSRTPIVLAGVLFLAIAFWGGAGRALGAQEKGVTPVPVPKDMLEGTRLVLKKVGATVDIPGPGWSWMTYENSGGNFMAVNSKTYEMYVVGLNVLKHEITDKQPQSLIAGAKKTQEARGGKVENDKFEYVETPGAKKAVKITFNEVEKNKKTFVCVYLIQTADFTIIKMHCNTPGASEPEAFKTMIKSLKIATPAAEPVPQKKE